MTSPSYSRSRRNAPSVSAAARSGTGESTRARLLARDEDVFVVLACAPARSSVHVSPEALLERETRPLQDVRIEVAPVVHDDEHGRARRERRGGVRERLG